MSFRSFKYKKISYNKINILKLVKSLEKKSVSQLMDIQKKCILYKNIILKELKIALNNYKKDMLNCDCKICCKYENISNSNDSDSDSDVIYVL